MPRPSNTDERRTQIADGLVRVMAKRGYDGATVSDVASEAGLTAGLVHYHFDNKQEILLVALDTLVARHDARLDAHLARARTPAERVRAFVEFHLGLGATADPEALACWVLLSGEALRQREVREKYGKAIESSIARLQRLIEEGVAARELRCGAPEEAAAAIVATIQGYFALAAAARQTIPKGSAARATLAMADGLLQPTQRLGKNRRGKR